LNRKGIQALEKLNLFTRGGQINSGILGVLCGEMPFSGLAPL
jgi:hypothetical protein